jgi:hypothetical protein
MLSDVLRFVRVRDDASRGVQARCVPYVDEMLKGRRVGREVSINGIGRDVADARSKKVKATVVGANFAAEISIVRGCKVAVKSGGVNLKELVDLFAKRPQIRFIHRGIIEVPSHDFEPLVARIAIRKITPDM